MIAEIGLPHYELPYDQPVRKRGITKNNFYTLWDIAMLGITNLSKVPLRFVTFLGFVGAALSLLTALAYLAYKLVFWGQLYGGNRTAGDWAFLFGFGPIIGDGHFGRVHRLDPHAGAEAALRDREGPDQLRVPAG